MDGRSERGASTSEAGDIVVHRGVRIDVSSTLISDVIRNAIRTGQYELPESRAVDHMLREGDVVVELGAGCGFISAYVAARGKARQVHAVEANPALIPLIAATHALNGTRAEIHNALVGAEAGEQDFFVTRDFWASRINGTHGVRIRVPMHAFAECLDAWRPTLVIMDVEGAERDLVRIRFPDHVERVTLEVHEWVYGQAGIEEVRGNMERQGFRLLPEASEGCVLSYARAPGELSGTAR